MAIPSQKKLLLPAFFLSGFASLIYEVIWARMLSLVFGSTVEAVSAVVTAFMAGLAMGSYFMSKWADRRGNILLIYSFTEIAIGTLGLFFYYLVIYLPEINRNLDLEFTLPGGYEYIIEFMLVFAPATLMGATFPLMVKSYVSSRNYVGEGMSVIYAVNTLGAALGAFSTGFFLIPQFGMRSTVFIAVTVNVLLALALYIIKVFHPYHRPDISLAPLEDGDNPKTAPLTLYPGATLALSVLLVLTVSGFASLAYQVAWTRVLIMVIGNSVYAFSTILTTFLIGLTIGSFAFARQIDRIKDNVFILGILQLFLCISVVGMLPMMDSLPVLFLSLFGHLPASFHGTVLIEFIVAFTVILVPTVLMGASFPVAARIYVRIVDNIGEGLGRLYSANTVGAVFGSFLTGFILIPAIGLQRTILFISALNLFSFLVLISQTDRLRKGWRTVVAVASVILFLHFAATVRDWNKNILNRGVYLYAEWLNKLPEMGMGLGRFSDEFRLLFYKEGPGGTVAVSKTEGTISLQINGKTDASTSRDDMVTQTMLAALPLSIHKDPRDVAIVGLGSGISLGTAERFPVRRIDCIEILPEVVKANRYFSTFNHNALNDRRANLIIDDGRRYLSTTKNMYDVIISEPSNPWIAGVSNLFTLEFFKIARERLKEDGLMCQWLHLYSMDTDDLKVLLNTFRTVFPQISVWAFTTTDLIALGSRQPIRLDVDRLNAILAIPGLRGELQRIGMDEGKRIESAYLMGNRELERFCSGAELNTDDRPIIEFHAPKSLYKATVKQNISSIFLSRKR